MRRDGVKLFNPKSFLVVELVLCFSNIDHIEIKPFFSVLQKGADDPSPTLVRWGAMRLPAAPRSPSCLPNIDAASVVMRDRVDAHHDTGGVTGKRGHSTISIWTTTPTASPFMDYKSLTADTVALPPDDASTPDVFAGLIESV